MGPHHLLNHPDDEIPSPYPDGLPGHHGQDTEVEAAERVFEPGSSRWKLLCYAREKGVKGVSHPEVQKVFNLWSMKQRLSELVTWGYLVDSGKRVLSPRRRRCKVYVAREFLELLDDEEDE
jgi:hypothetical protein